MVIAYKGFNKDLTCRGMQFYERKWHEEPEANCVRNGFHCAENPLDCLSYYPDWENSVYYMVLADGDIDEDTGDSKIACTRIKLLKKLALDEFVQESIQYMITHPSMEPNRIVRREEGEADGLFVIVRGKDPVARGKRGSVLGFAKEAAGGKEIREAAVFMVDGKNIMPDVWYRADGQKEWRDRHGKK